MGTTKVSFIVCVNDEVYYNECAFYIKRLHLPTGFELELCPVRGAESIYQGYNKAMKESNGEYKVYLHQDVFLIDQEFLISMVKLFESHPRAGLAGVMGATDFSSDRRFYRSWNLGNVLGCSEKRAFHNELGQGEARAAALDGMLLMTRVDLPWRSELLTGWDFYDISQSLEFQKEGYEVWVPAQPEPWCIHDCGYLNLTGYDRAQEEFLEVYGEYLPDYSGRPPVYPEAYRQRFSLMMEMKEQWKALLFLGHAKEVRTLMEQIGDERFFDTEIAVLKNILEILEEESRAGLSEEKGFLYDCGSFIQAYQKYLKVKFWLRRRKYAKDALGELPAVTHQAERVIARHTMQKGRGE